MKNNNYPNWLVSLEIAQQLKGIGFKEKCLCYWYEHFHRIECSTDDEDRLCPEYYDYNTDETTTSLPTWGQVFEWFREKGYHGIIAVRYEDVDSEYSYRIEHLNDLIIDFDQANPLTYEEAREELVKALIQTYKNEQL